jgi:hypothetical protein
MVSEIGLFLLETISKGAKGNDVAGLPITVLPFKDMSSLYVVCD